MATIADLVEALQAHADTGKCIMDLSADCNATQTRLYELEAERKVLDKKLQKLTQALAALSTLGTLAQDEQWQ